MKTKTLAAILFTLLIIPLSIEGLLRVFDPWGAKRYADDSTELFSHMGFSTARGYTMLPGTYRFSNWHAIILPDGSRAVPDTKVNASCTIALLGDSVTFGYGVSDVDTWANLLAREFPAIHIINTGVNGYNIENIWGTYQDVQADGYLYTMVGNDADAEFPWRNPNSGSDLSVISLYINWIRIMRIPPADNVNILPFYETLDKLASQHNVVIVGLEGKLIELAKYHDQAISIVPIWKHNNSRVDGHANATGNIEFASIVRPVFEKLIKQVCKA